MKRIWAFVLVLIICFTVISPTALAASRVRNTALEDELAYDLKNLGLFKGISETDFDLTRAPTRTEALVMLIRVLGKESEALSGNWAHPFTDVASWADKYVGYAYEHGLANGISATRFGTGCASACMYLTFILRALGYSDTDGADFEWDNPFALAKSLDVLPVRVEIANFLRADAVLISYLALTVTINGESQTLAEKLISAGVFTREAYATYYDADAVSSAESQTALSAEEIYSKCSPAVFYIEVFNSKGDLYSSGSGFFIDSKGTAVTNFHVIADGYSAKITVSNTKATYDVLGVYDYNEDEDWAILKINGSGFSYLKTGNSSEVVGGETVYAIGSPLGLESTMSQGIVSNPKRQIEDFGDTTFIQTTAAISSGSSGGALISKYGEVIGITTASSYYGQNINIALPSSYFKNYSTSGLKTLLATTVNPNSKLIPYTSYPEVMDFGAYYGVDLFGSNSSSAGAIYYYTLSSLVAIDAWSDEMGQWVEYAPEDESEYYSIEYPLYFYVLDDWGWECVNEFSVGSYDYWQFALETDTASYMMNIGTTKYLGTDCLSIQIFMA